MVFERSPRANSNESFIWDLKTNFTQYSFVTGRPKGTSGELFKDNLIPLLTEKGRLSTLEKAEKIRELSFDAVFCSDLSRTAETMKLIQGKIAGLPEPVYTPELREIDFGDLTGGIKSQIMPTIFKHKEKPDLPYPNGESGGQFIARVKGFFSTLTDRFAGGQVLVVTHFGVMETAARQFSGPPSYESIHIGADDVWLMCFGKDGSATRKVL